MNRRLLQIVAVFAVLLVALLTFNRWRYGIPIVLKTSLDQEHVLATLQMHSGIKFPPETRVLFVSDNDARNAGYVYYILFSPSEVSWPGSLARAGEIYAPELGANVRSIEDHIAPFKIREPKQVMDFSWRHGVRTLSATTVVGRLGSYSRLDTALEGD